MLNFAASTSLPPTSRPSPSTQIEDINHSHALSAQQRAAAPQPLHYVLPTTREVLSHW